MCVNFVCLCEQFRSGGLVFSFIKSRNRAKHSVRQDAHIQSVWIDCLFLLTDAVPQGVLDVTCAAPDLGEAAERPLGVLALEVTAAVVDFSLALVDVWWGQRSHGSWVWMEWWSCIDKQVGSLWFPLTLAVVVVGELIARPAAYLPLAAEWALCVDAALTTAAVTGAQQTLVDVWEIEQTSTIISSHLVSSQIISSRLMYHFSTYLLVSYHTYLPFLVSSYLTARYLISFCQNDLISVV